MKSNNLDMFNLEHVFMFMFMFNLSLQKFKFGYLLTGMNSHVESEKQKFREISRTCREIGMWACPHLDQVGTWAFSGRISKVVGEMGATHTAEKRTLSLER